jgi:hypothetical protein
MATETNARELDERIGLEIMGWKLQSSRFVGLCYLVDDRKTVRYPSQRIDDAFLVVERMREDGYDSFKLACYSGKWVAEFYCGKGPCERHGWPHENYHGAKEEAGTAPLAIALAALAAMKGAE